ncbi:hypothetical protein [Maribacter sp. 2210JD10-5]|uniref:hypothetical protein n=1 Tax=Maribacter sp. 2210JD10-5 TaxID=3386272 RepID=UPI0039BCF73F
MKTILKFTTVIAFLFTITVSTAAEPKIDLITDNGAKGLILTLQETTENLTIRMKDANEYILYNEKFSSGLFRKKFDLENLDNGIYYLISDNGIHKYTYTIEISKNNVEVINKHKKEMPFFKKKDRKVLVHFLNLNESQVNLKVYDDSSRLLFSEIMEEMIIEKSFNFNNAFQGSYTVVIEDDTEVFSEELTID